MSIIIPKYWSIVSNFEHILHIGLFFGWMTSKTHWKTDRTPKMGIFTKSLTAFSKSQKALSWLFHLLLNVLHFVCILFNLKIVENTKIAKTDYTYISDSKRLDSVFRRQFLITDILSVSLKFGACYITGQRNKFKVSNTLQFSYTFLAFFVVFHHKIVFLSFPFFLMKYQISATEY